MTYYYKKTFAFLLLMFGFQAITSQVNQQIVADKKKSEFKIATRQEIAEKGKNQQVLEAASTYTVDSIIKGLADLQLEFGGIVRQLSEKLANEIIAASKGEGGAFKKKEDTHRMAEANKAFSHFKI